MVRSVGSFPRADRMQHGRAGRHDLFQRIIGAMESVEIDALATTGPNLDVVDLRAPKNVHLIRGLPMTWS